MPRLTKEGIEGIAPSWLTEPFQASSFRAHVSSLRHFQGRLQSKLSRQWRTR